MDLDEKRTIETTRGILEYARDWDCDGAVRMFNARTIDRYKEMRSQHPDVDDYGVWFAFSNEQFEKGRKHAIEIGKFSPDDKITRHLHLNLFGTKESIASFYGFYEKRDEQISKECDPQEVYFYEYNNHECMISWNGDKDAISIIEHYWGKDVAGRIKRI